MSSSKEVLLVRPGRGARASAKARVDHNVTRAARSGLPGHSALALALLLGACRGGSSAEVELGDAGRAADAGAVVEAELAADAGRLPDEENSAPIARQPERFGFCARPGADSVRDIFCEGYTPHVGSMRDLQDLIRVNPLPTADRGAEGEGTYTSGRDPYSVPIAAFLAHSTSLSGNLVSPLNPRVLLFGPDTIMAFQRGIQRVELASRERDAGGFKFYLLTFHQACNTAPGGCSPGDLYTPRIENEWTSVEVQDDEDLKNSVLDCRQCHQRGIEAPLLLMRELESPWTHFFELDTDDLPAAGFPGVRGRDLVQDYLRAKADEPYAGVPTSVIRKTSGLLLETFVGRQRAQDQLLFDAPRIEDERWPLRPDGTRSETALRSAWWDAAYEGFKRGEILALPHFEQRPTDAAKQAALSEAYQRYLRAELSADELPEMSDVFPDDPHLRAEIGLQTEPDATPAQALIQACGSCHNDVLDQSLSRALFNIDLSRMSRAERDLAVERLQQPTALQTHMPPLEARQLDARALEPLITYLRRDAWSAEDQALLARAARLGMAATRAVPDAY